MTLSVRAAIATICALTAVSWTAAQSPPPRANQELESLQAHFQIVIKRRHDQLFSGIRSIQQWEKRKQQTRAALQRMLWHDLTWPDRPPRATMTSRQDYATYTVENLVLETVPGVFLTANLYLPRGAATPVPVLLYQCGHASKSLFRRHGAWFASHGMAMLVMDNIEMGEIEFTHHGVYANAWFHWYSRGFSPLAVELLNARRAVDYLVTRPDLDRGRIGATGRSGGGMTTFFLAALDDRIAASAPVSGTLSTKGWIEHRGSRALEQNLRSFTDDDLLHHMKRQAMVAGTTLESMQVYEVLRSLELLRSLPDVDAGQITILGKGADGVNGMYAAVLDAKVSRVVLHSPPASHVHGPHYLGILRYTDIPETAGLLGDTVRILGETPDPLRSVKACPSLQECLRNH